MQTSHNTKLIKASTAEVYKAFTTPELLEKWLAPGNMTGKIHHFDLRKGGSYSMSLFYPQDSGSTGKTAQKEDRYIAKFLELVPGHKIMEEIVFDSGDTAFAGNMIMEVLLEPVGNDTQVSISFSNIPRGIKPGDNESGTAEALEKLARLTEHV